MVNTGALTSTLKHRLLTPRPKFCTSAIWKKEQDLQRLKLVVVTKNVIPKGPITMNPMLLKEPAQLTKVVKGELSLPTKEDPSINLDQHKSKADNYAKQEYKIIKILNHCTLDYTTQYLV